MGGNPCGGAEPAWVGSLHNYCPCFSVVLVGGRYFSSHRGLQSVDGLVLFAPHQTGGWLKGLLAASAQLNWRGSRGCTMSCA